jgi:sugar phosphate isomerase/epimerase
MSSKPLLGVQLYSLRDELARDFDGTIAAMAAMGVKGVEPWGGLPVDFAHAAKVFQKNGLLSDTSHLPLLTGSDKQKWLDAAHTMGVKTIVLPYLPPENFADASAIQRTADQLYASAQVAQTAGFAYAYHNHWWEFAELNGTPALYQLAALIPEFITFEVDVYWAQVAKLDPAEVLRELRTRAPLLHLKDGPADSNESPMVAAGEGVVDFSAIVSDSYAGWGFIELDKCATDMLEAIRKSARYFLSNNLAIGKL